MEKQIKSLDLDKSIGSVTLSDGATRLDVPKLSMGKIIKVVKFLGVDGAKLYGECREILIDENLDDIEKVGTVFEALEEEQLVHIFSILLDMRDEDVLLLDINEMLEIMIVYVDKTDLAKTFTLVRHLMKKLFNKEMPDIKQKISEILDKTKAMQKEEAPQVKVVTPDGTESSTS